MQDVVHDAMGSSKIYVGHTVVGLHVCCDSNNNVQGPLRFFRDQVRLIVGGYAGLNPLYPTQHDRVSYKKRYIMHNIYLICLSLIYAASSDTQLLFFTKKLPA